MPSSQLEGKQQQQSKIKLHTDAAKFYDGAYGNARTLCGISRDKILPFCIVAVLSYSIMDSDEIDKIKVMFHELQTIASPEKPFFCHVDVYDDLAEIDKMRCKNAFRLENGEIHFPSYAVTIRDPTTGKYMGNTFQIEGKGNMQEVFVQYFQQAAHHVATLYREKGDKPWWYDPIHEMQQIENPEERESEEQRVFQDETERNFQKAVKEGFNLEAYGSGPEVDELTRGMAKVLARDPKEKKMREIRRNLRMAIEIGDEEAAKFEIARASIKQKQADILKELMLVDTEDESRAEFVEKLIGNMEKNTDAFVERLKDQYVSLMNSIEKLRKLKGKRRAKMAKAVAKQVDSMKSAPLWMLGKGAGIGKALMGEGQRLLYKSQSGADVSFSGLLAAVLNEVMPNEPSVIMFNKAQQIYNMADSLSAGADSISRGLTSMSLSLEVTNQQYSVMETLTSAGGIFSGSQAKEMFLKSQNGEVNQVSKLLSNISKAFTENPASVNVDMVATEVEYLQIPEFDAYTKVYDFANKKEIRVVSDGVKGFYEKAVKSKSNFEALTKTQDALQSAGSELFTRSINTVKWAAGKAMTAYSMYELTNQFISDATYMVGMKNTSYTSLRRAVPIVLGIGSVFAFPAIASGLAAMYGGAKLVGSSVTAGYTLLQMLVVGSACGVLGTKSEGCEKVTRIMKKGKKYLEKHAAKIPKFILYAIAGEKLAATLATSQYVTTLAGSNVLSTYFSGTIVTGTVSYVSSSLSGWSMAALTIATANPMAAVAGVAVVGALAVGGIQWYKNKQKQQYDKTKRHLLQGGKVLLPEGWQGWVHPQASSLWFAHPASGRIQDVFPTETEFVDKRGRRVADMTLEFGINRPTKKQEVLAKELAASIGDEDRMRRALAMWIHSKPRPGAKLLAEHHILKQLVGESSFAELRQRKRLSAGGNYLRTIRVLSDGRLGISKSVLGLVGKHATYHDLRSLVLL